jgi:hypothetical protein
MQQGQLQIKSSIIMATWRLTMVLPRRLTMVLWSHHSSFSHKFLVSGTAITKKIEDSIGRYQKFVPVLEDDQKM